jgi:hypothetical protein
MPATSAIAAQNRAAVFDVTGIVILPSIVSCNRVQMLFDRSRFVNDKFVAQGNACTSPMRGRLHLSMSAQISLHPVANRL